MNGGPPDEVKSQVVDFYYKTDVIYSAPGLKDEVTVWTQRGKEKMRKYYLKMHCVRCEPCLKLFTQTKKWVSQCLLK